MFFRIIMAVILIALGLSVIGLPFGKDVFVTYYPVLILLWGIVRVFKEKRVSSSSVFIIILGALLQWSNLSVNGIGWPKALLASAILTVGISYLLPGKAFRKSKKHFNCKVNEDIEFVHNTYDDSRVESHCLFSGTELNIVSQSFEGGEVSAIFGGAEIDLSCAKLHENKAVMTVSAIFGGIEIIVPKNIKVHIEGFPIFGSISNNTKPDNDLDNEQHLYLNITAKFGGVEIKN